MKRYDLRHLKKQFAPRVVRLADGSGKGEVSIFIFEIVSGGELEALIEQLKRGGHIVMNSLRFNEVDWTIVVKSFVNEPRVSNPLFDAFEKYGVETKALDKDSAILSIGTHFAKDNESLVQEISKHKRELIYMSAQEDPGLKKRAKAHIKYEVGSEAGVLALIAKSLLDGDEIAQDVKSYLDELDEGYLSAESNVGEEEIEEIKKMAEAPFSLLIGCDLYEHPDADLIAGLIALISRFKPLRVSVLSEHELRAKPKTILPPQIDELKSFDGTVVYFYESDDLNPKLYGSSQFALAAKLKNGNEVLVTTSNGTFESEFHLDKKMKGTVALLGVKKSGYRYERAKVSKRETNG
ncbi:MAG: hypothetical protein LBQ18_00650 [Campylobacteraceae bacterium]|jgi:NADH-quinone oxidoreductase subunit F|nr:hypothetical protein [Campylobacteraceae bacterium]